MLRKSNPNAKIDLMSVILYVVLALFLACNNTNNSIKKNTDSETILSYSNIDCENEPDMDIASNILITVIPEQDPNGIYWGLRDTVSNKLVLDYNFQEIQEFREGFAIVKLNDQTGLINKDGKIIINLEYWSLIKELECGIVGFAYSHRVVFFDTLGKRLLPQINGLEDCLPCKDRITFKNNAGVGMLNFQGDTILPLKFSYIQFLKDGFCRAAILNDKRDNIWGLYDINGKQLLPHDFEFIQEFHCGLAVVKKKGKYGVIDKNGKELFYTDYGKIEDFAYGYAKVYSKGKTGIIDHTGREVVELKSQILDYQYGFIEGMAVREKDGKIGFIDTTGKLVIPYKYDWVGYFRGGITKVRIGKHFGYINKKGEDIIPPSKYEESSYSQLGKYYDKFIIGFKDSVFHVYDFLGKEITQLQYENINDWDANTKSFFVSLKSYNLNGVLDSNFQVIIPVEYKSLEKIFPKLLAAWTLGDTMKIFNMNGKLLSNNEYDWIKPFPDETDYSYSNGLAMVGRNDKVGVVNSYLKIIIPVKYEEIEGFNYGLAVVKRNNKYGYVNIRGKEVIPVIYDEADSFRGDEAEVTLKGESFRIDKYGKRIEDEG